MTVIVQQPKDSNGNPQPMVYDQDTGKIIVDSNGYVVSGGQKLINVPTIADYVSSPKTQTSGIQEAITYQYRLSQTQDAEGNAILPEILLQNGTYACTTDVVIPDTGTPARLSMHGVNQDGPVIQFTNTNAKGFIIPNGYYSVIRWEKFIIWLDGTSPISAISWLNTTNNGNSALWLSNITIYGNTPSSGAIYIQNVTLIELTTMALDIVFPINIFGTSGQGQTVIILGGYSNGSLSFTALDFLSINNHILPDISVDAIGKFIIKDSYFFLSNNNAIGIGDTCGDITIIDVYILVLSTNSTIWIVGTGSSSTKTLSRLTFKRVTLYIHDSAVTAIHPFTNPLFGDNTNYYIQPNLYDYNNIVIDPNSPYTPNIAPISIISPTVPASGTPQQNTNAFPVNVYLYGGAVTEVQITKNGTAYTVFSASTAIAETGQSYRLNPGDSITVTYSTAPTWEWLAE